MTSELIADAADAKVTSNAVFRNFSEACRSPETRSIYTLGLHYFMDYLRLDRSSYDKLLEKDPRTIQMDVRDYIIYLREKKASYATISTYVAAISKFYAKNFISINTKHIKDYMGEHEKVAEDRPYTHTEIQTLVNNTNRRNKAIILLMCSVGPRLGAVPLLRLRDLEPIDQYNIYKIHFYAKSKKHNYHGYCTPECRAAIDSYSEYRKRWGERLSEDSPLFRVDYNAMVVDQQQPGKKGVQPMSILFATLWQYYY